MTIRINTLKSNIDTISKTLSESHISCSPIPDVQNALFVNTDSKNEIISRLVSDGEVIIQNPSSILCIQILNPSPNELILDACAAPGVKTSHISALMKNTGQVFANDISTPRIHKMKALLDRMDAKNVYITNIKTEDLYKKFPITFDKILLDAPCSMTDRVNSTPGRIKSLSQKQKIYLKSCFSCLKSSGVLLYSTCTDTPEENEQNVDWALENLTNISLIHTQKVIKEGEWGTFFIARFKKN